MRNPHAERRRKRILGKWSLEPYAKNFIKVRYLHMNGRVIEGVFDRCERINFNLWPPKPAAPPEVK